MFALFLGQSVELANCYAIKKVFAESLEQLMNLRFQFLTDSHGNGHTVKPGKFFWDQSFFTSDGLD